MNRIHLATLLILGTATAAQVARAANPPAAPAVAVAEQRELHVVALYEGNYRTGNKIHGGKAAVEVNRAGKVVTLILSAYDPVTWTVTTAQGSRIGKVILTGYKRQAVEGLPKDVEVVDAFVEGRKPDAADETGGTYLPYDVESGKLRPAVKAVHRLTDLPIRSYQGAYAFKPDAPFRVDKVQADVRLDVDFPMPAPADALPKLQFEMLRLTPGERHRLSAALMDFTQAGPKAGAGRAVPDGVVRIVMDPQAKKYYGLTTHELVEIDMEKQAARKIDVGMDVPPLSWPCGIALDTKRQRLLVASRAGARGYLYAYSLKTNKWSVLSDTRRLNLAALTYDPADDALYGLGQELDQNGEGRRAILHQFDSEGALVKNTLIGEPMFAGLLGRGDPSSPPPQMTVVDGHLVILAVTGERGEAQAEVRSYLFLVNRAEGTAQLAWKK